MDNIVMRTVNQKKAMTQFLSRKKLLSITGVKTCNLLIRVGVKNFRLWLQILM